MEGDIVYYTYVNGLALL